MDWRGATAGSVGGTPLDGRLLEYVEDINASLRKASAVPSAQLSCTSAGNSRRSPAVFLQASSACPPFPNSLIIPCQSFDPHCSFWTTNRIDRQPGIPDPADLPGIMAVRGSTVNRIDHERRLVNRMTVG